MDQEQESSKKSPRSRKEIAVHLADFEKHLERRLSQRDASAALGVPRSTLRHWKNRKDSIPIAQSVIECLESPDGTDFLHLLIVTLEFVMIQVAGCGIRLVALVLTLTHLNNFVAGSYESLRRRSLELENNINTYGEKERHRRSEAMSNKKISVAEDETFHPQTCLVAIEPASNFILLEKYSEKRDAASWNAEMDEALSGLNVKVIQSTSDEAKGIVNHAEKHLVAHHSPDIFHVQHDISKGCSASLALKTRHAQKEFDQAVDNLKSLESADVSVATSVGILHIQ
ncbi:helix-turn-helix domain-containing protein [Piscirickettsia salmonis]|uniref:helix-turn-helix domain-containing protein n=1 Tax=Piscirickettsia salmonis TaxID=1238 RepID=UPI0012B71F94|nr:helix-turn-helix domain-containing protein [Piscirickettsia salmonis]